MYNIAPSLFYPGAKACHNVNFPRYKFVWLNTCHCVAGVNSFLSLCWKLLLTVNYFAT